MSGNPAYNYQAFIHWLSAYTKCLNAASTKANPAEYAYKNGLRTYAFMLQGLSRIHKRMHNKKRFTKMCDSFKQDEDLLGQIDYYAWLLAQCKGKRNLAKVAAHLQQQLQEAYNAANSVFKKKYFDSNKLMLKVEKKLYSADWHDEVNAVKALTVFYGEEIQDIENLLNTCQPKLSKIEEQVHEVRRQLRWLSIYPQALLGSVQYSTSKKKASVAITKLITRAERASTFNKLPAKGKRTAVMPVSKNHYLANSHVIAQLGDLKDRALLVHGIAAALMVVDKIPEAEAKIKATSLLGEDANIDTIVLQQASILLTSFRKARVLHGLVLKK
jgi:hypothetical protein